MKLSDFTYELSPDLIAHYPLKERSASRLLCLNATTGAITHQVFTDILSKINSNDLLVCNNTRVIPARFFGQKASGGKVEVLVERILDDKRVLALVRASKSPKPGSILLFAEDIKLEVVQRHDNLFELTINKLSQADNILDILEKIGQIPLPPYFHREPDESDKERYQTVFAEHKGSVAAPTAGLHFDDDMMQKLRNKGVDIAYVTLHIGAGTFAPVRVDDIKTHRMHSEYLNVSEEVCEKIRKTKANGGRVIAVGTTSARSLETASRSGEITPFSGDTDIFIYPGYQFQCVDALITNLHLPGSTLLMLVSALGGYQHIMKAYQEAVEQQYRFFSYGDAMFIEK
jgi:S-adenosylmethionine:tRNA ribosyltransferase-isomerase